jgi:Collagen triple helix repeat (20 copies)
MNHREVQAVVAGVVPVLKEHCDQLVAAMIKRIAELEAREYKTEAGPQGEPGPKGEHGEKGEKGEAGEKGEPGPQGEPGPAGAEGPQGDIGARGSDGDRGPQGEKGIDGRDGRDGVPGLKGEDGRNGVDGRDGFSLEDLQVATPDFGRTIVFSFLREGQDPIIRTIRTALVLDRGVYKDGHIYEPGDGVTWGGSFFIAQAETVTKPETDRSWRLAVKRGRNGADGKIIPAIAIEPVKVRA